MILYDLITGITSNFIYDKLQNNKKQENNLVNLEINIHNETKNELQKQYSYNKEVAERLLLTIDY
jgi:hypothetical protein